MLIFRSVDEIESCAGATKRASSPQRGASLDRGKELGMRMFLLNSLNVYSTAVGTAGTLGFSSYFAPFFGACFDAFASAFSLAMHDFKSACLFFLSAAVSPFGTVLNWAQGSGGF